MSRPRKVFAHRSEERLHDAKLEAARITRLLKRQLRRRTYLNRSIINTRKRLERATELLAEAARANQARIDMEKLA